MASAVALKKNYRNFHSLQQRFYTGGPSAVSEDGSFIACACDGNITVVDCSTAAIKATFEFDPSDPVTALAVVPECDDRIYSGSRSGQIRLWHVSDHRCSIMSEPKRPWEGRQGPVTVMACNTQGLLASAGKKLRVWSYEFPIFKHKGVVTSIMFHPDVMAKLLFTGGEDGIVRVWDYQKCKSVTTLENHQSAVTSIAVTDYHFTLVTAGRDGVVNIWDLQDYSLINTIQTNEAIEALCIFTIACPFSQCLSSSYFEKHGMKFSSTALQFITVGERGIVRIWNTDGPEILFEQRASDVEEGFTSAVALSDQGLLYAVAGQQFLIYNLEKDDDGGLNLALRKRLIGYNQEVIDMKFVGDEEQYLAVASSVKEVRVYDVASGSCSYMLSGHTDVVLCIDSFASPFGDSLIVSGSKDNTVRLWDTESRRCVGIGIGHEGAIGAIAFSKTRGNFFVSGSRDCTLKVWSLDGVSDDVLEVSNLKVITAVAAHSKNINTIAVAPNDKLVCSGSQDHTAAIWKLPELLPVVVLKGHRRGILSVEFSPVDRCVITASGDKTIKIWAISDGSCLKTFEGHIASVTRASFITRGRQFVSCGADGLVKLWRVETNECLATYDQHEDKIWALAIGKKTEMLATGGRGAVINLWHDSVVAEKEEASKRKVEDLLRGRDIENAFFYKDHTRAVRLAFELRKPNTLMNIFGELHPDKDKIEKTLRTFAKEEIRLLLEYIREWSARPRVWVLAASVLRCLFTICPRTDLVETLSVVEPLEDFISYFDPMMERDSTLFCLLDDALSGKSIAELESSEPEPRNEAIASEQGDEYLEPDTSTKKRSENEAPSQ